MGAMGCDEIEDRIERLAAGEAPGADASAHLRDCPRCAASLARARQIDRILAALPVSMPTPSFTEGVLRRVRPVRWESERRFDLWFNLAMAASLVAIAAGIWGALNATGLAAITRDTADLLGRSVPAFLERAKPQISLYGGAAGLVIGSLGLWWWLERAGRPHRTA